MNELDIEALVVKAQNDYIANVKGDKDQPLVDAKVITVKHGNEPKEENIITQPVEETIININKEERKEDKISQSEKQNKKSFKRNNQSIVESIRIMDKSSLGDKLIHVRVPDSIHKKLLLYGQDKLKIQSIASFAISYLLETKEMQDLLNTIKNDMD